MVDKQQAAPLYIPLKQDVVSLQISPKSKKSEIVIEDSNSIRSSTMNGSSTLAVNQKEIEDFISQKDLSWVLASGVIEKDLSDSPSKIKVVSKVVYSQGKYIMTYIEGYLSQQINKDEKQKLCVKISGVCSDNTIVILEEELSITILESLCKILEVHEVLPVDRPLSSIKTFEDFARFCIFPFV